MKSLKSSSPLLWRSLVFCAAWSPCLHKMAKMYRLLSQLNAACASLYLLYPQLHRRFVTFSPAVSVFKITLCSTLYTRMCLAKWKVDASRKCWDVFTDRSLLNLSTSTFHVCSVLFDFKQHKPAAQCEAVTFPWRLSCSLVLPASSNGHRTARITSAQLVCSHPASCRTPFNHSALVRRCLDISNPVGCTQQVDLCLYCCLYTGRVCILSARGVQVNPQKPCQRNWHQCGWLAGERSVTIPTSM